MWTRSWEENPEYETKEKGLRELTWLGTGWCGPVCDPPTQLLKSGSPHTCLGQSDHTCRCCSNGSPRLRYWRGRGYQWELGMELGV